MTLVLFLISFLTRLLFLYFGHPSITHDEADYFLNSYLLTKIGTDILNQKIFLTSGILYATSAIPVYLGSLIFYFFEKSVIVARFPFVLLNSFTSVLFYLILNKLTKNKTFSLIGFTIFNFSPWFSYLSSQSAFDSPISLLFYLASFYILLTEIKPIYKNILFFIFSFFSFNSYMGIKTSFPFLIFTALIAKTVLQKNKINLRVLIKNFLVSCSLFLVLFTFSYFSPSSQHFIGRFKEKLLPFNIKLISNKVTYERSITSNQNLVKNLLFNKVTAFATLFSEKYIQAFNPYFLFVKGDQHVIYGTNYLGLFYLFDFIFLMAGFYFASRIFSKNQLVVLPFFLLFVAGAIPIGMTIDTPNISIRGYPLIVAYVFFISVGAYYLLKKFSLNFLLYLAAFIFFFSLFQVVIKNASANQWHLTEKNLSQKLKYLKEKSNKKKIVVYVNEPRETLLLYLFYQENNPLLIKRSILSKNYSIGNLSFSPICPQEKINNYIQIIHSERCPINTDIFKSVVFIPPENNLSSSYFLLK